MNRAHFEPLVAMGSLATFFGAIVDQYGAIIVGFGFTVLGLWLQRRENKRHEARMADLKDVP